MKVLVTFYTQTGNTEKVAKAIYEAVTVQKEILPLAQARGRIRSYFLRFSRAGPQRAGKNGGLHQGAAQGAESGFLRDPRVSARRPAPEAGFRERGRVAVILKVLGQFGCRGKVDPKVIDDLMKKPEHKAWAEEALGAAGTPMRRT